MASIIYFIILYMPNHVFYILAIVQAMVGAYIDSHAIIFIKKVAISH